jgi:signal transduction histidine kinase
MHIFSKRSLSSWGLMAALTLILAMLAVLQYEWIGQVGEAQRERMQATLHTAMNQFRQDLDRELSGLWMAFEVNPAGSYPALEQGYAKRYAEWARKAAFPGLVANVFLREGVGEHSKLLRLNKATGRFEPAACPPEWASLCANLARKPPDLRGEPGRRFFTLGWRLEGSVPLQIHPLFRPSPARGPATLPLQIRGYAAIELSRASLQRQLIPEMVQRHFGGPSGLVYEVAVLGDADPAAPLYISDPLDGREILASPDAVLPLFGDGLGSPPGRREHEGFRHGRERLFRLGFHDSEFRGRFVRAGFAPGETRGAWRLVVKRRFGSVENAVALARRRNLAVSFGILLVLAVSMAMLVVWTERAQRLAKLQVNFIAGISHELRTPLAVISSAADNLASGVVDAEQKVRRYGALISSEARRLSSMVGQVLLFASDGSGPARFKLRPVQIEEIVERALAESRAMIDQAGFKVEKNISPSLPPAAGDPNALTQCLMNLISNAVKYGHAQHWLGIRGQMTRTPQGPEIEVTVEDQGSGIESDDLPHIFEPFYRGRAVVGSQVHGTGLGLSLAKRVAEAMGGRLSVESAPGRGSAFTLHLPALLDDKPAFKATT